MTRHVKMKAEKGSVYPQARERQELLPCWSQQKDKECILHWNLQKVSTLPVSERRRLDARTICCSSHSVHGIV